MSNIRYYATTGLFWQTLEAYSGHALFPLLRAKIDECVIRKGQNATFRSGRDKPFDSDFRLQGIWHCKLSDEIDAVLFYTIRGDTLSLNMVGTHHDYPADGKNGSKAAPTAQRNRNAEASGHVDHPSRRTLRWSRPGDLIANRMIDEMDRGELRAINAALLAENDDPVIFERVFGKRLLEDATDTEFYAWLAELRAAQIAVARAFRRIDMAMAHGLVRREIAELASEAGRRPDVLLTEASRIWTIEGFIECLRAGLLMRRSMPPQPGLRNASLQRADEIIEDFERHPQEVEPHRILGLARNLATEMARRSFSSDDMAHAIENSLEFAQEALSLPDEGPFRDYIDSRTGSSQTFR